MIDESAFKAAIKRAQDFRRQANKALRGGNQDEAHQKFRDALDELDRLQDDLDEKVAPDANDPMSDDVEAATLYADLWGIRGGIYRDMETLDDGAIEKAIKAYDEGAAYERDFELKSTYNCVNQLVVRVLADVGLLDDPSSQLALNDSKGHTVILPMLDWLARAEEHVKKSIPRRYDKEWAYADLVLLAALRSSPEVGARWENFKTVVKESDDKYPFESLLSVVRSLVRRPLRQKSALLRVGKVLRQELPEEKRGAPMDE
jgi:hypothetical protein